MLGCSRGRFGYWDTAAKEIWESGSQKAFQIFSEMRWCQRPGRIRPGSLCNFYSGRLAWYLLKKTCGLGIGIVFEASMSCDWCLAIFRQSKGELLPCPKTLLELRKSPIDAHRTCYKANFALRSKIVRIKEAAHSNVNSEF